MSFGSHLHHLSKMQIFQIDKSKGIILYLHGIQPFFQKLPHRKIVTLCSIYTGKQAYFVPISTCKSIKLIPIINQLSQKCLFRLFPKSGSFLLRLSTPFTFGYCEDHRRPDCDKCPVQVYNMT